MPTFPLRCCQCSHEWTAECERVELFDQACPSCLHVDAAVMRPSVQVPIWDKTVVSGNRQFTGDRQNSLTEGWHPAEVGEARRLLGDRAGSCIQRDGSVKFKDRDEQRAYTRSLADVTERLQHSAEARRLVGADD